MSKGKTFWKNLSLGLLCFFIGGSLWAQGPCRDNFIPPKSPTAKGAPTKLSAWNQQRLKRILRQIATSDLTALESKAGQNLSILNRYRKAIVRDAQLRSWFWEGALRFKDDSASPTTAQSAQAYQAWQEEVILQDIIPHIIKKVPVSADYPEGLKIEVDQAELALIEDDLAISDEVTDALEWWLKAIEKNQKRFLKIKGKKFVLAKTAKDALAAEKIIPIYRAKRWQRELHQQVQRHLTSFWQNDEALEERFAQSSTIKELYTAWCEIRDEGIKLAEDAESLEMANRILTEVAQHPEEGVLADVLAYMAKHRLSTLAKKDFYQRLPAIYNVYIDALHKKLNSLLADLLKKTGKKFGHSREEFFRSLLPSSVAYTEICRARGETMIAYTSPGRVYFVNADDLTMKAEAWIPVYTKQLKLSLAAQDMAVWKVLAAYGGKSSEALSADQRYLQKLLQLIVRTFEDHLDFEELELVLGDINKILLANARNKGEHQAEKDAAGVFRPQGNHHGMIEIDDEFFGERPIYTQSVLIHELGHWVANSNDLRITDFEREPGGGGYSYSFSLSEVSTRVRELVFLKELISSLRTLVQQDPSHARRLMQELHDILQQAGKTINRGRGLAQRAERSLNSFRKHLTSTDGQDFTFKLEEYSRKGELTGYRGAEGDLSLHEWSRPSPNNNNYATVEVDIPDVVNLRYQVKLQTSADGAAPSDEILINYPTPSRAQYLASAKRQITQQQAALQQMLQDLAQLKEEYLTIAKEFNQAVAEHGFNSRRMGGMLDLTIYKFAGEKLADVPPSPTSSAFINSILGENK